MFRDFTKHGAMKMSQFGATIQIRCGHVEPPYREFILTSIQRIAFSSAIASVLAAAPFAAQAGSYASASAGQLSFQLIDLDASDSILPSYTLNLGASMGAGSNPGAATTASVFASDGSLGWSDSASKTRNTLFYPLSLDAAAGQATAHAEVTPTTVSANGSAAGQGTSFNASAGTNAGQNYYYNNIYAIDLSPRSVLLVTARLDASAWAGNAQCTPGSYYGYGMNCGNESSSASASMNLSYSYVASGVNASYTFSDSVSAGAAAASSYGYGYDPKTGIYGYFSYPAIDQSKSSGKWLTAVFTNSTDLVQRATLGLSASVQGSATTAIPIPEASTTAMFALGLLGLVGVARRRA